MGGVGYTVTPPPVSANKCCCFSHYLFLFDFLFSPHRFSLSCIKQLRVPKNLVKQKIFNFSTATYSNKKIFFPLWHTPLPPFLHLRKITYIHYFLLLFFFSPDPDFSRRVLDLESRSVTKLLIHIVQGVTQNE